VNTSAKDFGVIRQIHIVLVMHFIEGRKQSEIATALNLSTAKVNRMIKQGRELGMVNISVTSPFQRLVALEQELSSRWQLETALVTPTVSNSLETTLQQVGTAAANLLVENISDGDVIAITGGKGVSSLVENLSVERKFDVTVVPLTGCVQDKHYTDVNHVATQLAERLGGNAMLIHAPLFAEDEKEKEMLFSLRQIREVFELAKSASIALTGVGSILTPSSSYYDLHPISAEDRKTLIARGAVGEFVAHLINENGELCDVDLNRRLLALAPDDVARIPKTIGIAAGEEKVKPVRAILNGKYLSSLVLDETTATSALKHELETV
jgi:DNA-binding transcriptional regulator LsrR (DeoR family)